MDKFLGLKPVPVTDALSFSDPSYPCLSDDVAGKGGIFEPF